METQNCFADACQYVDRGGYGNEIENKRYDFGWDFYGINPIGAFIQFYSSCTFYFAELILCLSGYFRSKIGLYSQLLYVGIKLVSYFTRVVEFRMFSTLLGTSGYLCAWIFHLQKVNFKNVFCRLF